MIALFRPLRDQRHVEEDEGDEEAVEREEADPVKASEAHAPALLVAALVGGRNTCYSVQSA